MDEIEETGAPGSLGRRFLPELDPRWPHAGVNASVARAILWLRDNREARPERTAAPLADVAKVRDLRSQLRLKIAYKDESFDVDGDEPSVGPISVLVRGCPDNVRDHLARVAPKEFKEFAAGTPTHSVTPHDGMLASWIDETPEAFVVRFAWDKGPGKDRHSIGTHCEIVPKDYPVEGMERVRDILSRQTLLCWDRRDHFSALSKAAMTAGLDGVHAWPKAWRSVREMFGIMFHETSEADRAALPMERLLKRYAVSKTQIVRAYPQGVEAVLVMRLHGRVGDEIRRVGEGGKLAPFPSGDIV